MRSCVRPPCSRSRGVVEAHGTCDQLLRRRLLCPLSYADAVSRSVYAPNGDSGQAAITGWRVARRSPSSY